MSNIEDFINRRFSDRNVSWNEGNCYWGAIILSNRFGYDVWYLPVEGHFVVKTPYGYYDMLGKHALCDEENPISWEDLQIEDDLWANNIIRDCIL